MCRKVRISGCAKRGKAARVRALHQAAFEELDSALTKEHCIAWKAEVEMWEDNHNDACIPNLFEAKSVGWCVPETKQLEAQELEKGVDVSLHPEVSPSVFIGLGLDLEKEQQCVFRFIKTLGNHITDTQKANLQHQRNTLQYKIESWRMTQVLYMPVVQGIQNMEDVKHLLPSAISNHPCHDHL
ncbi:uncharacterized protein F5891DRAFT_973731 [Suillus fuscotomentosus]|uniref:Uncharacterized protein n=1 Tax=Suillus fuscotomentosus TaxID=1912939 RepID=A0AAD4EP34_9AGAM|nr:uncharacterized protein F5891DRAFT_973731 [Suillus fuscotomentosus]KAG1908283.1 hypothetical protein F5891DRAFT_973731 [Suillus fuscotomentosus]